MRLLLLACAGGAIGAGLRYLVGIGAHRYIGAGFPWGTLIVNIVGSFLMGLFIEIMTARLGGSAELRTFVATGVLGGFTTFSAYSLDFAVMIERGAYSHAWFYLVGTVVIGISALFAGLASGRVLFP